MVGTATAAQVSRSNEAQYKESNYKTMVLIYLLPKMTTFFFFVFVYCSFVYITEYYIFRDRFETKLDEFINTQQLKNHK